MREHVLTHKSPSSSPFSSSVKQDDPSTASNKESQIIDEETMNHSEGNDTILSRILASCQIKGRDNVRGMGIVPSDASFYVEVNVVIMAVNSVLHNPVIKWWL